MDKDKYIGIKKIIVGELSKLNKSYIKPEEENSFYDSLVNGDMAFFIRMTDEKDVKTVLREFVLEDNVSVVSSKTNREPWFSDFKKNNRMLYWNGYKKYLEEIGFNTIQLDYETDIIMDKLTNPMSVNDDFDKRGLVFGNVQSGKTSNFIGLLNKAADAGYKLFIILSGMYSDLRKQTQERIDIGAIGRNTEGTIINWNDMLHVGKFHNNDGWSGFTSYTTIEADLNDKAQKNISINFDSNEPKILVCKKNSGVLKALFKLLSRSSKSYKGKDGCTRIREIPLLVIDDEADSAGVNTNYNIDEIQEASTINKQIRCLLTMFDRSAYVGYTGTPYANVLMTQDANDVDLIYNIGKTLRFKYGDDLFPNDFLISLKTNENYIGAAEMFDYENPVLKLISNYPDAEMRDFDIMSPGINLPPCVKKAIRTYIAGTAVKRLRGIGNKHSTMLFHASRLVDDIDSWAMAIYRYINTLKENIENNTTDGRNELNMIYFIYDKSLRPYSKTLDHEVTDRFGSVKIDFDEEDVKKAIVDVLRKIQVRSIHSDAKSNNNIDPVLLEPLNYSNYINRRDAFENGLYVIAVGGNKLSRGLTLEGLIVSFFYRYPGAFDTLMQMGRWFGYRPGYYDLCRLFITKELEGDFKIVSRSSQHLRNDIEMLMQSELATPRDVIMRIRIGDSTLLPTARNRMGDGSIVPSTVLEVRKETSLLKTDIDSRKKRVDVCMNFFNRIGRPAELRQDHRNNYVWENVSGEIVESFVREFKCVEDTEIVVLDKLLESKRKKGMLTEWTVVLVNNNRTGYGNCHYKWNYNDVHINLTKRENKSIDPSMFSLPRGIFAGRDENLDFANCPSDIPIPEIRNRRPRERGLLVIYSIIFDESLKDEYQECPLIGFGMSFPTEAADIPELLIINTSLNK